MEEFGGGGGAVGACSGNVTDEEGNPIAGVSITLDSNSGWGWGWGWNSYNTQTLEDGTFLFEEVEVGDYSASAFAWGYMWDFEEIEIVEGETTVVDFVLESWGGSGATGTFSGTVADSAGAPVEGAFVSLHSDCGWGWGWGWGGNWYFAETLEDGSFIIEDVEVGEYSATACAWGVGWDSEEVEIVEGETTVVDFVLEAWGWGGGGGFDIVNLRGNVTIEQSRMMDIYNLDTNGDGIPDYRLNFGPDWYHPPSGAQRPANGQNIEVVGGLLGHSAIPTIIVYEKNQMFWREPLQSNPETIKRLRDRRHQRLNPESQVNKPSLTRIASYPNPFNPETTISYSLNNAANVKISIFNMLGQQVASLVDQNQLAGEYHFEWNAGGYSSGYYFVNFNVDGKISSHRLLLVK